MPKPHKPRCAICGEDDHKLKRVVVVIDGKQEVRRRLCSSCAAMLTVMVRSAVEGRRK
jgi:transcriptional regulator NrdR family protein